MYQPLDLGWKPGIDSDPGHDILAPDLRFQAFLRVGCSPCSELLLKEVQILSTDLDLGGKAGHHILALEICGFSQGRLLRPDPVRSTPFAASAVHTALANTTKSDSLPRVCPPSTKHVGRRLC